MEQAKIGQFLLQKEVRWVFNPPAASHMGGIWEHMIKSVCKVLNALLKNQSPNDEGLSTLICEVEASLTVDRWRKFPMTRTTCKHCHRITYSFCALDRNSPPGIFAKNDQFSKKRWRQVRNFPQARNQAVRIRMCRSETFMPVVCRIEHLELSRNSKRLCAY